MVSNSNIRGIIGPDCKRILIYPGAEKSGLITSASCLFDLKKLETELAYIDYKGKSTPFFININNATVENNIIYLGRGEYPIGMGLKGNAILGAGWYNPESWGAWSNGNQAIISFPCSKEQFYAKEKRLNVDLYIQPFTKQNISIKNSGIIVFKDEINISKTITFSGDVANCRNNRIEFDIAISNPTSPLELGQSSDVRKLGIAIVKFKIY